MNQPCPICGSDDYTFYGDYHYDTNFKRIKCRSCGKTPVLKPKKEFEMSCIYCGSKLEKLQENDGYNILECSNPKCNHNRTSCRMDKNFLKIVKSKLEKELTEVEKDSDIIPTTDANIPKEKKCEKCGRRMVRYTTNKYCEIWVCPTFFRKTQTGKWNDKETKIFYKVDKEKVNEVLRKSLTELGIGEYFTKDSRFSENIILRAIELFFKYPWANHNDVVKMLADEGVEVSNSTVYEWIIHSSILFNEAGNKYKIKYGKEWRIDETFVGVLGLPIFLWVVIDEHRQIIAWSLSLSRDTVSAVHVIKNALDHAGFKPQKMITDGLAAYHKAWTKLFWANKKVLRVTEHIIVEDFKDKINNNLLERFNGTFKNAIKSFRGMKAIRFLISFVTSFMCYYNFIRPHTGEGLNGLSPVEASGSAKGLTNNIGKFFSI
jgi:transposase-like protein/ribosomal protein S27E